MQQAQNHCIIFIYYKDYHKNEHTDTYSIDTLLTAYIIKIIEKQNIQKDMLGNIILDCGIGNVVVTRWLATPKTATILWQGTIVLPVISYPTSPGKNLEQQWIFGPVRYMLIGIKEI